MINLSVKSGSLLAGTNKLEDDPDHQWDLEGGG
jgi:hypothetical protein